MNAFVSDSILKSIEQGILGLLLALGAACILLFAWRWRAVGLALQGSARWQGRLARDLSRASDDAVPAVEPAPGEPGSADRQARLGLDNAHLCPEALEKLLQTQEIRERKLLERGCRFLGTVGANAPFLGLTGTVLGILSAFRRMAEQGGSGGVEVMSAIAGALIATAAGLMVAIPAVVLYNLLKGRVGDAMDALGEIRQLLVARSLQAAAKEPF
jgi:biopolymer transport protein ExbB/TolQ